MEPNKPIEDARRLLVELKTILENEGETNWIKGVLAALVCLERSDVQAGYDDARSIYRTMVSGNGSFSEYYIQCDDPLLQSGANRHLDHVREQLWRLFQAE